MEANKIGNNMSIEQKDWGTAFVNMPFQKRIMQLFWLENQNNQLKLMILENAQDNQKKIIGVSTLNTFGPRYVSL